MGHHATLFPTDISYGSRSGFGFNHGIVHLRSGAAEYVSRHSDMRHVFDVSYGIKSWAQLKTLKDFYAARGGLSNSFLYQDPLDMNTSSTPYLGDGGPGTIAQDDQQVWLNGSSGAAAGGETSFQLTKIYSSGSDQHVRTIRHPVNDGTIKIEKASSLLTEGTDYSVDYDTGIVTLTAALTASQVVKWGGSFYVRARFAPEVDRALMVSADTFGTAGVAEPIPLFEEINSVAHRDLFDYGSGSYQTADGSQLSLSYSWGRAIYFDASADTTIIMPDPSDAEVGGPYFYVHVENGDTYDLTFKDTAGTTTYFTVGVTNTTSDAVIVCADNGTANTWLAIAT